MNGSNLRDYIVRAFKRTDKDTEIYEAITDTIIDIKLRYPHDDFKVEAYTSSIATLGDYKVDVPSDLGHMVAAVRILDGEDSWPLSKISKERFDILYPNPNSATTDKAKPKHYCVFGGQILVGPVPDSVDYDYEITYSTEEVETITSATATVPFSTKNRELLKFGVLYRLYADLENFELAELYGRLYEAEIIKVERRDQNNTEGVRTTVFHDI